MATLREYFDTDFNKCLTVHTDWQINHAFKGALAPVRARITLDFDANAKYWSFFIPDGVDVHTHVTAILRAEETSRCVLSRDGDSVYVEQGIPDCPEGRANSSTLVFTQRVILYIDALLPPELRQWIVAFGSSLGFSVVVEDRRYAMYRSEREKPLAFISHDSRDKESLVRELAMEMNKLMCPVWYDEYSLKVGDSLRASIERGLKEASKCVVVLSPNFFSNEGWSRAEFDSIYTREIIEKNQVMLPIWHNVSVRDVYDYSPRLADKWALNSELGAKQLARLLVNAVRQASA